MGGLGGGVCSSTAFYHYYEHEQRTLADSVQVKHFKLRGSILINSYIKKKSTDKRVPPPANLNHSELMLATLCC